jgi:hypothetical protein
MSSNDPEPDGGPDAEQSTPPSSSGPPSPPSPPQPGPPSPPSPEPLDVDSAFAAIVAAWGTDTPTTWPAQEDLSLGRHRLADDPPEVHEGRRAGDRRPEPRFEDDADPDLTVSGLTGPLTPSLREPEEVVDHSDDFVPPDPPLPRGDAVSTAAWAAVLLGPAFLLFAVLFWKTAPQLLMLAAVAAFIGGFVFLVSRLPSTRDDDEDDGAVV